MKIGVLSNLESRRNVRNFQAVRAFLGMHKDIVHVELLQFASLKKLLLELADAKVEILVINAGDGTISAVLTEIYEHGVFRINPALVILPGGTSNTIAADVGMPGDRVKSLQRLMMITARRDIDPYCVTRQLIRVEYDPARSPIIGMFFGTAAICNAIALRRRLFPQRWMPDPLAGALTLATVLVGVMLGRSKVLSGHAIGVRLDSESEPENSFSLVIVTTLSKIFLGSSPFWSNGNGSLKFTSIRSPADGLVRNAYRLLYGRDKERLPQSVYQSAAVDEIQLQMRCSFNLDGEFMQGDPDVPVKLTSPFAARFVQY